MTGHQHSSTTLQWVNECDSPRHHLLQVKELESVSCDPSQCNGFAAPTGCASKACGYNPCAFLNFDAWEDCERLPGADEISQRILLINRPGLLPRILNSSSIAIKCPHQSPGYRGSAQLP